MFEKFMKLRVKTAKIIKKTDIKWTDFVHILKPEKYLIVIGSTVMFIKQIKFVAWK